MTKTENEKRLAPNGLRQIENSIFLLLKQNPNGLRNAEIAERLDLHSDFCGQQKDYLTYSVLGGLIKKRKVIRNQKSKLFFNKT